MAVTSYSIGATTNTLRFIFITEGVFIGLLSFVLAAALSVPVSVGCDAVLGTALRGKPIPAAFTLLGIALWLTIVMGGSHVSKRAARPTCDTHQYPQGVSLRIK